MRIKLRRLEEWNQQRRAHARAYTARLEGVVTTPFERPNSEHVYYVYVIQTDARDPLRASLAELGIQTGIHYPVPLHLQPACAAFAPPKGAFPVTERLAGRILSLPMFPELTTDEIDGVCEGVRNRVSPGMV